VDGTQQVGVGVDSDELGRLHQRVERGNNLAAPEGSRVEAVPSSYNSPDLYVFGFDALPSVSFHRVSRAGQQRLVASTPCGASGEAA